MTDQHPLDRLATEREVGEMGRSTYHAGLATCDDLLVRAATRVATSLPDLASGLLSGDGEAIARGSRVATEVTATCEDVEDRCLVLIAREAPVGRDLRLVVAMLRLAPRVHRAAQLSRHVPEALPYLRPDELPPPVRQLLEDLVSSATQVFARGVEAWRIRDGLAVTEVADLDARVDDLQQRLVAAAVVERLRPEVTVACGLLGRYLERIGDHGVALARDATFVATGARLSAGHA